MTSVGIQQREGETQMSSLSELSSGWSVWKHRSRRRRSSGPPNACALLVAARMSQNDCHEGPPHEVSCHHQGGGAHSAEFGLSIFAVGWGIEPRLPPKHSNTEGFCQPPPPPPRMAELRWR